MATNNNPDNSLDLSLPQSRTVRGCEINRIPLGAFLQAAKQLQDFPAQMLAAVFPKLTLPQILLTLKTCDTNMLWQMLKRALLTVPDQAVKLIAKVTAIPESKLMSDPNIGLDGLGEIMTAWYEVNRIESFFVDALGLYQGLRAQKESPSKTASST